VARDSVAERGGPTFRCQHPAKTGILMDDSDAAAPPVVPPMAGYTPPSDPAPGTP
jgi:hypothetical protein